MPVDQHFRGLPSIVFIDPAREAPKKQRDHRPDVKEVEADDEAVSKKESDYPCLPTFGYGWAY